MEGTLREFTSQAPQLKNENYDTCRCALRPSQSQMPERYRGKSTIWNCFFFSDMERRAAMIKTIMQMTGTRQAENKSSHRLKEQFSLLI